MPQGAAKTGDQSLSNGPGSPQRLRCGAFVHFPPAESGQKGRRGAFIPRAKCPPEPPVRPRRGWLLQHPSPASAAGLRFSLWGTEGERHIPAPWLPLTRELSPQATEGENLQPVGAGRFPMGVHHISPSVKPSGFATSLVRGRQDERRRTKARAIGSYNLEIFLPHKKILDIFPSPPYTVKALMRWTISSLG